MRQVLALPVGRRAIEEVAARIAVFVDPATGRAVARPAWAEIFPILPRMVRHYYIFVSRCVNFLRILFRIKRFSNLTRFQGFIIKKKNRVFLIYRLKGEKSDHLSLTIIIQ